MWPPSGDHPSADGLPLHRTHSRLAEVHLIILFSRAEGARQSHSRIGMARQRQDAIILCAGQRVLCGHHLDVVSDAIAEAVLRKCQFALRKQK